MDVKFSIDFFHLNAINSYRAYITPKKISSDEIPIAKFEKSLMVYELQLSQLLPHFENGEKREMFDVSLTVYIPNPNNRYGEKAMTMYDFINVGSGSFIAHKLSIPGNHIRFRLDVLSYHNSQFFDKAYNCDQDCLVLNGILTILKEKYSCECGFLQGPANFLKVCSCCLTRCSIIDDMDPGVKIRPYNESYGTVSYKSVSSIILNRAAKNLQSETDKEILGYLESKISKSGTLSSDSNSRFTIKEVKFSKEVTIVFWNDNTKTVVKKHSTEKEFDPEKAIFAAYTKKILNSLSGNAKTRSLDLNVGKWVDKYYADKVEKAKKELSADIKKAMKQREEEET